MQRTLIDKVRNPDFPDHELIMALAKLSSRLNASHVEKYQHFYVHMGRECPYTIKSKKAFRQHKEELIQLISELHSNIFKE